MLPYSHLDNPLLTVYGVLSQSKLPEDPALPDQTTDEFYFFLAALADSCIELHVILEQILDGGDTGWRVQFVGKGVTGWRFVLFAGRAGNGSAHHFIYKL
jgi:hypothetical protein